MSELQLSDQLIESVQKTLVAHDQSASEFSISVQYMAAIIGYVIGKQNFPNEEKKDFIDQLYGFTNHVMDDITQGHNEPPPTSPQEAFGIWKPDNK